jgi:hypothetical protein
MASRGSFTGLIVGLLFVLIVGMQAAPVLAYPSSGEASPSAARGAPHGAHGTVVGSGGEIVSPILPGQTAADVFANSKGCVDCHNPFDSMSMHRNPGVLIGCTDCHGGNASIRARDMVQWSPEWEQAKEAAHVAPTKEEWWPTSGNPERPYTKTLKESAEYIKFINPGDLRVARETCGGCHSTIVHAVERSIMTTSAMLWGGASYNNNILPYKRYILGESYGRDGLAREIHAGKPPPPEMMARGALPKLIPLPQWEVIAPGDVFRVFERGGLFIRSTFPEIGNPNPLEESGRPDIRQSNRGPATGNRIAVPVINIHKTRLNDPHLSFMGTNDHPGDFRSSGCTACHSIYANDRDPRHSGPWAKFGHAGLSFSKDPMIPKDEPGHPITHEFSRAIPTSQCMVCHMHQPNMFVNSYLGYTMWDYESDAKHMWPEEQRYPKSDEMLRMLQRNPEEAVIRGKWSDEEFLRGVWDMNPKLKDTQFADYHGHGWNFRAIFKKDRKGHLLDKDGKIINFDDPEKFKKAVHMSDIHVDYGMHCVDCHFHQDGHGDGNIYGEVAQAVEIQCHDCHGTLTSPPTLRTSGPAAPPGGRDLSLMRTPFGDQRFIWKGEDLYQRSTLTPGLEWKISQVRQSVDPTSPEYNEKSARAKTLQKLGPHGEQKWGDLSVVDAHASGLSKVLAHADDKMACFACHSAWMTSCGGCHLPIQANWKVESKHYDGKTTRNWATYNPQVVRDDIYQLGLHGPAKGNKIVPVRSSSALVLSSTDINRQKIYIQQPPTAASGHSSQAFAPHFPHTVRKTETKSCEDCHVSSKNDNNAIMAQLLLHGTNFMSLMGYYAWVATGAEGLEGVQVTEWDEPQAVIGSFLHRYAYPDYYQAHQERALELATSHRHHGAGGITNTIQMRGEYLFTTAGEGGFRAYDIANIANKGFSERIVTAPFSPLGHDTHVATTNATSFVLPSAAQTIAPFRKQLPENMETPLHPLYHYALISDSVEGLILVNVDTLADGDPRNNFFERALTWNEGGVLSGARYITTAGTNTFVLTDDKVVILDLDKPLEPRVRATLPLRQPTAVAVQFRYAFATDADGLKVIDITNPDTPRLVASLPLDDARNIYVARTYAYIAAGKQGVAIVDVERPDRPKLYQLFNDGGRINDTYDVKIAATNASVFAYVADGVNGMFVLQLTDPDRVPTYYGFSPEVKPQVISWIKTGGPAMAISEALERDRAVDETGHQIAVFGRIGSRPFNLKEQQRFYISDAGMLYTVKD